MTRQSFLQTLSTTAEESLPCCECSESRAGRQDVASTWFWVPGSGQRAGMAAVRRGFSAEHGHSCWPCSTPEQMASLAHLPSFVYTNLSSWSSLKSPVLVFLTNCIYLFTTGRVGDLEPAWGFGISLEILPRSKNGQEMKLVPTAQAICEVFFACTSCWPYL